MSTTDTSKNPSLNDYLRPSSNVPLPPIPQPIPMDAAPIAKEAPPQAEVNEAFIPPTTPKEQAAQGRVQLYQDMQEALTPIEDYHKHLADHAVTEDEAARIVDDLLTKGFYEETFRISKRVTATLRTREQRDVIRIQMALQVQRPVYTDTLNELVSRYNVAASLSAYNGKRYDFGPQGVTDAQADSLFDVRLREVERMPSVIFSLLTVFLAKFDRKVVAVMREGVAENF